MAGKEFNWGIEKINPKSGNLIYASSIKGRPWQGEKIEEASQLGANILNSTSRDAFSPVIGSTPIVSRAGMHPTENAKALSQMLANNSIVLFDTETLGSSRYSLQGSGNPYSSFEIPEIAVSRFGIIQEQTEAGVKYILKEQESLTLATQISQNSANLYKTKIEELKVNPRAWAFYNNEERRTLTDLILYSDGSNFKKTTIGGQSVMQITGHVEDIPSIDSSPFIIQKHLGRMQTGLENISDINKGFVNTKQRTMDVLHQFMKPNEVLGGQNDINFDRPGVREFFGDSLNKGPFGEAINRPILDIYPIASQHYGKSSEYIQPNMKLESFIRHLSDNGTYVQSHEALGDVRDTAKVVENLLNTGGMDLFQNFSEFEISPNEIFVAKKPIQAKPNSYNLGENEMSFSYFFNNETDMYENAFEGYQPNPTVRNASYQLRGQTSIGKINGHEHYAIAMYDISNDTINLMLTPNKNYITDKFAEGTFVRRSEMNPFDRNYHKQDNARRAYEKLTSGKLRYSTHDPLEDIQSAYKNIDEFTAFTKGKVFNNFDEEEVAIAHFYSTKLKQASSAKDRPSFAQIRNSIHMRDVLESERDVWETAFAKINKSLPVSETSSHEIYRRRGELVNRIGQGIQSNHKLSKKGETSLKIGASGSQLYEIQMSVLGNTSYLNVEDPDKYQSSVRSLLRRRPSESKGDAENRFHSFFRNITAENNTEGNIIVGDLKHLVMQDIQKYGEVQNGTMDIIARKTYGIIQESPNLVTGVKPTINQARFNGLPVENKFVKGIEPMKSDFANKIVDEAIDHVSSSYSGGVQLSNNIRLNQELVDRIDLNNQVKKKIQDTFVANQNIFGFDQGEVNKFKFIYADIKEELEKTINNFEGANFNVALVQEEATNRVHLLFTPNETGINLANMDYIDAVNDPMVGRHTLPLFNELYGLDTYTGASTADFDMKLIKRKGYEVEFVSRQKANFDSLNETPEYIRGVMARQRKRGDNVDIAEAVTLGVSKYRKQSIEETSAIAYNIHHDITDSHAILSPTRNIHSASIIQTDSILENYLMEKNFPKYERWMDYKEANKGASIFKSNQFWQQEAKAYDDMSLSDLRMAAYTDFQETTGIKIYGSGVSTTAYASGKAAILSPHYFLPYGHLDSQVRETGVKAMNFTPVSSDEVRYRLTGEYKEKFKHLAETNPELYLERVESSVRRRMTHNNLGPATPFDITNATDGTDLSLQQSISLRTAYTNDAELWGIIQRETTRANIDLESLRAELLTLVEGTPKYLAKELEIAELESFTKEFLPRLSAHEGQSIVRESAANSMVSSSIKDIILPEGQEIPDKLIEIIAEETRNDYIEGQALGLRDGEFYRSASYFDKENLKELGLIDSDNVLLIGKTAEYVDTLDDGYELMKSAATSRIVSPEHQIIGVGRKDGQYFLQIEETHRIKSTDKIMEAQGGMRSSIHTAKDAFFDRIPEFKNTDVIMEYNKVDRHNMGSAIINMFNTVQENTMFNLQQIDFESINDFSEIDKFLFPGIRSALQEMLDEGQNINEINIDEAFERAIAPFYESMGFDATDTFIERNPDTGIYQFVGMNPLDKIDEVERLEQFRASYRMATQNFGFDEKHTVTNFAVHNTFNYAGTGTKPKHSFREAQLRSLESLYVYGEEKQDAYDRAIDFLAQEQRSDAYSNYMQRLVDYQRSSPEELVRRAHQEGNVVLDISGDFIANDQRNFEIVDGVLRVDGLSIETSSGGDTLGSISNSRQIHLYNNELDFSMTLGEYLDQEEGRTALLQLQQEGDEYFDQDYLMLVGRVEEAAFEGRQGYARSIDKMTENIYEAAVDVSLSGGIPTEDYIYKKGFAEIDKMFDEIARFQTDKKAGSATKKLTEYQAEHGGAFRIGTFNQGFAEASEYLREHHNVLSRKDVSTMIDGLETSILEANNITNDIRKESGKTAHEYILDRLTEESDDFAVYGVMNRFPNQTTGNVQMMSLKIHDAVPEGAAFIKSGSAARAGADFDGDFQFFMLDAYKYTGSLTELQSAMKRRADRTLELGELAKQADITEGINFSLYRTLMGETNPYTGERMPDEFIQLAMRNRDTPLDRLEGYFAEESKGKTIGRADNFRMRSMTLSQTVINDAIASGLVDAEPLLEELENLEIQLGDFLQKPISTKKMTLDSMGIDMSMTPNQVAEILKQNTDSTDEMFRLLQNPTKSNKKEFLNVGKALSYIDEENVDAMSRAYDTLIDMSKAAERLGYNTSAVSIGLSSGQTNNAAVESIIKEKGLSSVLITDNFQEIGSSLGYETESLIRKTRKAQQQAFGEFFANKQAQQGASSFAETASEQIEDLARVANNNRMQRAIGQQSSLSDIFKTGIGNTVNSSYFKLGAGLAAGWVLSSAIKGGPTPEGNEAQQEASFVEVAPAALLTSPTARVTPRGENITMQISGKGNVDPEEIAGIVNEGLTQQTSMQMDMNIYQTDNTQKLDNSFYENQLSRVLGV